MIRLTLIASIAAALAAVAAAGYSSNIGTVYKQGNKFFAVLGKIDHYGVAWGNYTDAVEHPSAFGELTVQTNSQYTDTDQMYAAGYLEGALTAKRIKQHYDNMNSWFLHAIHETSVPQAYKDWFNEQDKWMQEQVKNNKGSSDYWHHVGAIASQFDGLVAGYNDNCEQGDSLTRFELMESNSMGDLLDLKNVVEAHKRPQFDKMNPEELMEYVHNTGHCSGLIKVTGNFSELYAGHSSWFTYGAMNRIYKNYNFQLNNSATANKRMSFSSYPGFLSSLDDFYLMADSTLIMVQTTNNVFNTSLYNAVVPQSLLAWQRVRVANTMSRSGRDWYNYVSMHNSGTYNNQYMIVNMGLFKPGAALPPDLLWVIEQVPTYVAGGDVTQQLERGYWPSYNVPYWPKIYNMSGYHHVKAQHRDAAGGLSQDLAGIDYQLAPRAKIFRRDQGNVVDMDSYKAIMRYNHFHTDPYANGDPWAAICSRGDLSTKRPVANGCYDTKVTSWSWFMNSQRVHVINGPTTSGGVLPAFRWSESLAQQTMHEGQPEVFNFNFEEVVPDWSIQSK